MKTKNNRVNYSSKVICPKCGTEISTSATFVNPDNESSHAKSTEVIAILGNVISTLTPDKTHTDTPVTDPVQIVADLIARIEDGGYIDVNNIVRRWIPSQCITMLHNPSGFHRVLKDRGDDYAWRVLLNDLKRQMKLKAAQDTEGFCDRNRWYNRKVALSMAQDYLNQLKDAVSKMDTHNHKNRKYVKLIVNGWNGCKGIYLDELNTLYAEIEKLITAIRRASHPKALYNAVARFDNLRQSIRFNSEMSPAFINAYKVAGAYYTIKDFIMFEGCNLKVDLDGSTDRHYLVEGKPRHYVDQQESLAALEAKAERIVNCGVKDAGYEMLGLLKEFLAYNDFDYQATKDNWARQSEARRLMRAINRNRRPRK